MTKKNFTWNDLAKAINKLSLKQRKGKVFMQVDDESVFKKVSGLEIIETDVYVNKDDSEDCGTLEELEELHGEDFNKKDYRLCTPEGTPFLWNEF